VCETIHTIGSRNKAHTLPLCLPPNTEDKRKRQMDAVTIDLFLSMEEGLERERRERKTPEK
jgi:hypothetical protein